MPRSKAELRVESDRPPICYAPFASLHLDPRGDVRACCQNTWQRLGNTTEQPLREIWQGAQVQRLREHLAAGDLGLGCELCAVELDMGSPDTAFLTQFDSLRRPGPPPEWPTQLELALSISCNLQCVMCNGDLSSSIRIHREGRPALPLVYDEEFFEELDHFLPHLEHITFLGGEPFLGAEPLRVMDRLIELGLRPVCHVNTNGTQWNDRVQRVLRALPFHVAISVDGASAATVESIRVGVDHAELVTNVDRYAELCRETGNGLSLTFCLMRENWHELGEVLAWGDRLNVDVFVNTVTSPPRHSLHHLGADQLAGVVASLSAEDDGRRRTLVRNRAVWERELRLVHGLQDRRRAGTGGPPEERARERAAAFADPRGVHVVRIGPGQMVTSIAPDPADLLGIDARRVLGQSSTELMGPLQSHFGPVGNTRVELHDDGLEERVFELVDQDGVTELLAVMAPTEDGGQTWFVAARSVPTS